MRVAVVVDSSNLYHGAKQKYQRKIDYDKLLSFCRSLGEVVHSSAFVTRMPGSENDATFSSCLRSLGYVIHTKEVKEVNNNEKQVCPNCNKENRNYKKYKADWDVGIAIDMVRIANKVDLIVLCCADADLVDAVRYVQENGTKVVVLAINICDELRALCYKTQEIGPGFLVIEG